MAHSSAQHIKATQAFIDANPTEVTLSRPTRVSDGVGGTVQSGSTAIAAQTMRIVALNLRSASEATVTADGQVVVPTHALIALPSAEVAVGDQFTDGGKVFEVLVVQRRPEWRIRAEVFSHA